VRSALVIEDSASAADQITRYLQEANIHVSVHAQGLGALEQAARLRPQVIFLDLLMPDQSGWDVLQQLKADPSTRDIPVIIVSVVDERARGMAAGAAAYLVKPVSREMLRQTLRVVSVTSEPGRQAVAAESEPTPTPAVQRILLTEDNEVNIMAMEDYLRAKGYAVTIARNGQEALDRAGEQLPHLILMDIQMPEMDGLEATRRLRARPECAATPIIALTALAMPGDRERCLDAGANEYMTKPVSLRLLEELIQQLLCQGQEERPADDLHQPEPV
jgi:CheY-like chemotaxis protein